MLIVTMTMMLLMIVTTMLLLALLFSSRQVALCAPTTTPLVNFPDFAELPNSPAELKWCAVTDDSATRSLYEAGTWGWCNCSGPTELRRHGVCVSRSQAESRACTHVLSRARCVTMYSFDEQPAEHFQHRG